MSKKFKILRRRAECKDRIQRLEHLALNFNEISDKIKDSSPKSKQFIETKNNLLRYFSETRLYLLNVNIDSMKEIQEDLERWNPKSYSQGLFYFTDLDLEVHKKSLMYLEDHDSNVSKRRKFSEKRSMKSYFTNFLSR